MEDAGDAEGLELGNEAEDGVQFALRAGDHDLIADLDADLLGEVAAENDGRGRVLLAAVLGSELGFEVGGFEPEVSVSRRLLTVRSSAGMMPLTSAKPARGPWETMTSS